MAKLDFFYDKQIRRFLIQFIRIVSGFQVQYGKDTLITVPVIYGDHSRQSAHILNNNSENTLNTVPMMAVYIHGITYDRDRVQEPYMVDTRNVRMRKRDPNTGDLLTSQCNAYTIERLMPVPYSLKIKLDVWTSNLSQKFQLIEQIGPYFNPSFEIQSTDNYFDWGSLTVVQLDDITFTSRSVPAGPDDAIDILTYDFTLPIWLSPPAKVKKLGVIKKVIAPISPDQMGAVFDGNQNGLIGGDNATGTPVGDTPGSMPGPGDPVDVNREIIKPIITPSDHSILLLNNEVTLYKSNTITLTVDDEKTTTFGDLADWNSLLDYYGIDPAMLIELKLTNEKEYTEISGVITVDPNDPSKAYYDIDVDTIPPNDLDPIDAIIDPLKSGPNAGLVPPVTGQRYLLVQGVGYEGDNESAAAWRGTDGSELIADADDIIEYDGTKWVVSFDASENQGVNHYVTNMMTNIQFRWVGNHWTKSYDGAYMAGSWTIIQ